MNVHGSYHPRGDGNGRLAGGKRITGRTLGRGEEDGIVLEGGREGGNHFSGACT